MHYYFCHKYICRCWGVDGHLWLGMCKSCVIRKIEMFVFYALAWALKVGSYEKCRRWRFWRVLQLFWGQNVVFSDVLECVTVMNFGLALMFYYGIDCGCRKWFLCNCWSLWWRLNVGKCTRVGECHSVPLSQGSSNDLYIFIYF